ncbi:MAG: PEP-CTERM sorting domain-containing protein [Gammaproteobacteria bacterium]|nr:PEP-CTERM sorting domain-containing protein [Gammaproteobacteria bacterium]
MKSPLSFANGLILAALLTVGLDAHALVDFGDAPDSYQTTLGSGGAYHTILDENQNKLFLGTSVDGETDGLPTALADGDDTNSGDDEDGIAFTSPLVVGQTATLDATVTAAGVYQPFLNAWMDFNGDGDWGDPGDQILLDVVVNNVQGTIVSSLAFSIPADAAVGPTYARFRLDSVGGLFADGNGEIGEVEDYLVTISAPVPAPVPLALMGLGLAGIGYQRRKQINAA